jgi:hypothetical protein
MLCAPMTWVDNRMKQVDLSGEMAGMTGEQLRAKYRRQ